MNNLEIMFQIQGYMSECLRMKQLTKDKIFVNIDNTFVYMFFETAQKGLPWL